MLKYMIDAHQESLECSGELMHLAADVYKRQAHDSKDHLGTV